MKNQKKSISALSVIFAVAVVLVIWSPVQAQKSRSVGNKDMPKSKMMEQCREMKEQKQKMMKDVMEQDSLLSEMVVKMNRVPEDRKMIVMAEVITRLVDQRASRDAKRTTMEEMMMKHMMQHMKMGRESMSQCPMMNDMKNMDEKSKRVHKMPYEKMK